MGKSSLMPWVRPITIAWKYDSDGCMRSTLNGRGSGVGQAFTPDSSGALSHHCPPRKGGAGRRGAVRFQSNTEQTWTRAVRTVARMGQQSEEAGKVRSDNGAREYVRSHQRNVHEGV